MFCVGEKNQTIDITGNCLESIPFVPQLKDTDPQVQRDGSTLSDTQEMEPSSSGVSTGTLSQAARKILAVLRAQGPHAGRRNQVHSYRHQQSQSGRLFSS